MEIETDEFVSAKDYKLACKQRHLLRRKLAMATEALRHISNGQAVPEFAGNVLSKIEAMK